ncbi:MAG: acyl-CoA dehydrogenase family protein [Bacillota bacterium]
MAHWLFSEEHEMFRKSVRSFVEKEIISNVDKWEAAGEVPRELYKKVGELGYLGLKYPEKYGGADDYLAEAIFLEEMSRCGSGGVGAALGATVQIAASAVNRVGTEEQKQKYLVPAIKGDKIAALGITEPGAGSDVSSISTTAVKDGDYYIVNGSKIFITNGVNCDYVVLAVKTNREAGHKGISLLIMEKETPGFTVGRKLDKLGWRASDTGELIFEDCRVPVENRLGEENKGFYYIMQNFQWERIVMALGAVVGAELALEEAKKYASQRIQFGRPLTGFQVTRHKLAKMATKIEAARALYYHSLDLFLRGVDAVKETSMAKLYATEVNNWVTDNLVQIHGGYGYMMEFPAQRYWRDARLGTIGGGTSEIMREIIAKSLGINS